MSHLDFSEDDLIDAMSTISTISEVDSRSLSPCPCPATPKLPADEITQVADAIREWKHPKFYWSDFVDIQVEGTLYRVPRVMMQQSETFKNNLLTENSVGALYADGITTQEMEAFLDVSDARLVTGDDHFRFEQWAGALAVANRMAIPRIRNYVIQRLQDALNQLDPFDCIDVADKYRVHEWLFQPFLRICERPESLSPAEILRLGPERSSAVGRVRENLLMHKHDLAISWVPKSVLKKYYQAPPQPKRVAMSGTVETALPIEGKRLIELETVLSKPKFQSPLSSGELGIDSILQDVQQSVAPNDLLDQESGAKPSYSVKALAEAAIKGSMTGRLTLGEICHSIKLRYPYYRDEENEKRLRNSTRHDMSRDPRFIKHDRSPLCPGRGAYWSLDDTIVLESGKQTRSSDNLKTIKVRNCLYRLPVRYFEQPHRLEGNQDHKGLSLDARDIITLPDDVAVSDWNIFLDIITARPFDEPLLSLGFSAWMAGLRFAERFGHESARSYIIQRIETDFPSQDPMDLLEATKIAGTGSSDWLRGLYTTLSQRDSSLSAEEIRRIGEEATAEVWKLRDRFIYQRGQENA